MPRYSHVSYQHPTNCTVANDIGRFCDAPSAPDMPFAICANHAITLYRRMHEMVTEVQANHHEHADVHEAMVAALKDAEDARPYAVYYIRVGKRIKIGKSTQLKQRLSNYPPGSELLAVEQGRADLEASRLAQFRHLLVDRKEWFSPGHDLMAHIASLQRAA